MQTDSIAVLVFDRISLFHLSVPFAVFGEDRRDAGVPLTRVDTCAFEKQAPTTSAGFVLSGLRGADPLERAGVIIVPD